ncbi:MAG: invasion associated locus B family protein [Pseudomonadota bacterium]|nr:invasion associated locus B family protein [Pseudomonadota bacterium]
MSMRTLILTCLLLTVPGASSAAEAKNTSKFLGSFGAWNAYASSDNGQPMCYMALRTHGATSKKLKRGSVWLTITHRPAENSKDVLSYTSGYNFKPGSDVQMRIGRDNFSLFTQKDTAWSRDAMTDHAIATDIRKNTSLVVAGVPAGKGAGAITDTVEIKGAAAAYQAIGKACNVPVAALAKAPPSPAKAPRPAKKKLK